MYLLASTSFFLITGCQKNLINQSDAETAQKLSVKIPDNFFKESVLPGVVFDTALNSDSNIFNTSTVASPSFDPNNSEEQLLLGNQLPNPYTVVNMQQAYNILYGQGQTLVANYMYVKFKPVNEDQLATLEDDDELELQDHPMDYEITQDGDYYQDPNLGTEDIPWLYTVVPINYTPPSGILYDVICSLYIPDNNLVLEGMAESIVASTNSAAATYAVSIQNGKRIITRTDIEGVDPYNPPLCEDPGNCSGGGGQGDNPPPPLPPGIYVEDQKICGTTNTNTIVPVRILRVVCKRWFKKWKGYTNDLGRFTVTKTFRNNVKVIIKTKNNLAKVSKVRGVRLWQMAFPVKKRLGVYAGNQLATLRYVFTKPVNASASSQELPYWIATTTHNSNIEFREYSTEFGVLPPPGNLKIMISNWGGGFSSTGAAPMFNKCHGVMSTFFAANFILSQSFLAVGDLNTFVTSVTNKIDVLVNYQAPVADYNCRLTSAWIKQLAYHELGHASHYALAGCDFWGVYRGAIAAELFLGNPNTRPYGDGTETNAGAIALGEMWGNHCEYIYANRHYGTGGNAAATFIARMQGAIWANPTTTLTNVNTTPNLNCYLAALESNNPNSVNDTWPWIPQGLPYDLFDDRNDFPTPINDNVAGYSYQQLFNGLQTDVRSIPAYRDRLLQLNGNNQQVQVNALFNAYNY